MPGQANPDRSVISRGCAHNWMFYRVVINKLGTVLAAPNDHQWRGLPGLAIGRLARYA